MQSGSASVLRRMQRRYMPDLYRSRIETIKRLMPDAGIGADVIVGFPGETDEEFAETVQFIESLAMSYLHVFTYSERPDTRAALMKDQVPTKIRRERNHILQALSTRKKRAFYESQLGRTLTAILEPNGEGYTENYVRVRIEEMRPELELVRVRLNDLQGDTIHADLLEILAERRESMLLPILCN